MTLAAHLPCYFPDLTILYKMCLADVFVLADDFQYTKHNLINRAKIKTAHGPSWLSVPVHTMHSRRPMISQVLIDTNKNWQSKHWKSLLVNYKHAAYFDKYSDFIESLYQKPWANLLDLNLMIIGYLQEHLNISTKIILSSELNLQGRGSERLISILNKSQCNQYFTEIRFKKYLPAFLFEENDIKLTFFSYQHPEYHQQFGDFVFGLSGIDLLFNEGDMSYKIITGK